MQSNVGGFRPALQGGPKSHKRILAVLSSMPEQHIAALRRRYAQVLVSEIKIFQWFRLGDEDDFPVPHREQLREGTRRSPHDRMISRQPVPEHLGSVTD